MVKYWSATLPGADGITATASMMVPLGDSPALFTRIATTTAGRVPTAMLFPVEAWTQEQAKAWLTKRALPTEIVEAETDEAPVDAERGLLVRELLRLQAATKAGTKTVKSIRVTEIKAVDDAAFEADVVISTGQIDRDREIIDPKGLFKAAKRALEARPIPLISSHDYSSLLNQIGEIRNVRLDGGTIVARARWYVGEGNKEADWGWNLAARKKVSAYSIGFVPNLAKIVDANLEDEKVRAGIMGGTMALRTHYDLDLVEASQVLVPSNPGALGRMLEKGIITEADFLAVLNDKDIPRVETAVTEPTAPEPFAFLGLKIADAPAPPVVVEPPLPVSVDLAALVGGGQKSSLVTDGKGLLADAVARQTQSEDHWRAASGLWYTLTDIVTSQIADAQDEGRLALIHRSLDEFVAMVTPSLLAIANLNADDRQKIVDLRNAPTAPQAVEVNAKALSLVLDQFQAKFSTLLQSFHAQLRAQTPTLPPIPDDSVAFLSAKEVVNGLKDLAVAAASDVARAVVRRELGDVDSFRRS